MNSDEELQEVFKQDRISDYFLLSELKHIKYFFNLYRFVAHYRPSTLKYFPQRSDLHSTYIMWPAVTFHMEGCVYSQLAISHAVGRQLWSRHRSGLYLPLFLDEF
jgi:hypothetical protein